MSLKRFHRGFQAPVMKVTDSVHAAAIRMNDAQRGVVLVHEQNGDFAGLFTERDLVRRVVAENRDPASTALGDVMTRDVVCISEESTLEDAVKILQEKRIRHLPLTGKDGNVCGVMSLRVLFHEEIEELTWSIESLEGYLNDSSGG